VVTMLTKKILLINNEPNVREVVEACLSHLGGWQVLGANSPLDGLQCAVQDQPDAILFDLSTFGMNFYTFLKKLRSDPTTQTIPVVLVAPGTKWLNVEPFQQFQVAGVIEYSPDPTKLYSQIVKLLNWAE
jgi:CheY-like chemotaxis protein